MTLMRKNAIDLRIFYPVVLIFLSGEKSEEDPFLCTLAWNCLSFKNKIDCTYEQGKPDKMVYGKRCILKYYQ